MSTIDVPTPGRVSFHRLTVLLLRDVLLAAEARCPSQSFGLGCSAQAIATYLRPVAYLERRLGS
jgi:hypothetical protein